MKQLKKITHKVFKSLGYTVSRDAVSLPTEFPADFDKESIETIRAVKPFTMTSPERIYALCKATRYISQSGIGGDVVECGVWKGGSMMAVARTLAQLNDTTRHLYLFDTFEGMTPPKDVDVSVDDISAQAMKDAQVEEKWCYASLEEVKASLSKTSYNKSKLHFVKGKVEDTLPDGAPSHIALLRLDTDWYESTKHEMIHLFPRLTDGAVLIVDDYCFWKGCRQAVDEYLAENGIHILLNRIDDSAVVGVVHRITKK